VIEVLVDKMLAKRGKTRYWLAKETRMSQQAIANICKAKTGRIAYKSLAAICDVLGCQPGDLLKNVTPDTKEPRGRISVV